MSIRLKEKFAGVQYVDIEVDDEKSGFEQASKELNLSQDEIDYLLLRERKNLLGQRRCIVRYYDRQSYDQVQERKKSDDALTLALAATQNMDGTFQLQVRKKGLFLTVTPPTGTGLAVKSDEILHQIKEWNYPIEKQKNLEKIFLQALGTPVFLSSRIVNPERDGRVDLFFTNQDLEVSVRLMPAKAGGCSVEIEDVEVLLQKRGVLQYKRDELEKIFREHIFHKKVVIAEGLAPKAGRDAKIQWFVETASDYSPFVDPKTEKVDFREIHSIRQVRKGQILAKLHPAARGVSGRSVLGKMIPARDGREASLEISSGVSLCNYEYIAACSGRINFDNKVLRVDEELNIEGDLDFKTGNIDFDGNVNIQGTIPDGFKVKVGGTLTTRRIGKARVEAGGDIVITEGIVGQGGGLVKAGGSIFCKFCERGRIFAGGYFVVKEMLLHSKASCNESLISMGKKGVLVGGKVIVGKHLIVRTLGSTVDTTTKIYTGIRPAARARWDELRRRYTSLVSEKEKFVMDLSRLKYRAKLGKNLEPSKLALLRDEKKLISVWVKKEHSLQEELNRQEELFKEGTRSSRVIALEGVHPGVRLLFGKVPWSVSIRNSGLMYSWNNGEILESACDKKFLRKVLKESITKEDVEGV